MKEVSQEEIFQAMEDTDFYPHPVDTIQIEETHIFKIFLTGNYVYKIKKPVDFGFLDFTTLYKRRYYCEREVLLNRRLASDVYLGVVSVHFQNGCFNLTGYGEIGEHDLNFIKSATLSFLSKHKELFEHRCKTGKIRDCHGDLRSEHIYFYDDIGELTRGAP